jgi:N-acetylglucosaminyl-diphospho-decaprenol L-rhamnosyltransferase
MADHGTAVVIVNYRTKELTAEAARSVMGETEVREVLVVDNGSRDGSAEFLRGSLPDPLCRIIESDTNAGFGRAANLAAEQASAPLLFFLNSDATLTPGSLGLLVETLCGEERIGVVGPAIYEADGRTLQPGAFGRFPRLLDPPWSGRRSRRPRSANATLSPDWISGVAMLVRRRDFVAVGGFDPDFEMYLEDVDLCRRLRRAGKVVRREPRASVVHLGGRSWPSTAHKRASYQASKVTYFRKEGATSVQIAYVRVLKAVRILAARVAAGASAANQRG